MTFFAHVTCHLSSITLVNTPAPGIHHHLFCTHQLFIISSLCIIPSSMPLTLMELLIITTWLLQVPHHVNKIIMSLMIDNNNNHLIDPSRCLTWTSPSTGWLTRTSNRTQSSTSSLLASLGDHLYHDYHHRHWVTVFIMIKHLQRSSSSFLFLCIF